MNEQILDAPSNVEKKLQFAGFWIRVGAYLIDAIILWLANFVISLLMPGGYTSMAMNVPVQIALGVVGIIYFVVMESSAKQATVGKMAVGIKVGNAQGQRISTLNALGRYFAKVLSALILLIGFIMVAFDSKKQGLHDKLAGTYVFHS